jgi:nitrogen fixation NifU-like protein
MKYSETVMDHFANPRNVGELPDADGIGEVGNPVCGDMMTFYIKVEDEVITDVKFKTFGCGAAIAVSSMVSEMARGKTLDAAESITKDEVARNLGGLPQKKMHCSNLGTDALHAAIQNFRNRVRVVPSAQEEEAPVQSCPACGQSLAQEGACSPCRIQIDLCPSCGEVVYQSHRCRVGDGTCE